MYTWYIRSSHRTAQYFSKLILNSVQVCVNSALLFNSKYEWAEKFLLVIYGCPKDLPVDHLWQKPSVPMFSLLISTSITLVLIVLFYLTPSLPIQLPGCILLDVSGWLIPFVLHISGQKSHQLWPFALLPLLSHRFLGRKV